MDYMVIFLCFQFMVQINSQPAVYVQTPVLPLQQVRQSLETNYQSPGVQNYESSVNAMPLIPNKNLLEPILRRAINIAMTEVLNQHNYYQNHYQNNIDSTFVGQGPHQIVGQAVVPSRRAIIQNNAQSNTGGTYYGGGPSQNINTNEFGGNSEVPGFMKQNNAQNNNGGVYHAGGPSQTINTNQFDAAGFATNQGDNYVGNLAGAFVGQQVQRYPSGMPYWMGLTPFVVGPNMGVQSQVFPGNVLPVETTTESAQPEEVDEESSSKPIDASACDICIKSTEAAESANPTEASESDEEREIPKSSNLTEAPNSENDIEPTKASESSNSREAFESDEEMEQTEAPESPNPTESSESDEDTELTEVPDSSNPTETSESDNDARLKETPTRSFTLPRITGLDLTGTGIISDFSNVFVNITDIDSSNSTKVGKNTTNSEEINESTISVNLKAVSPKGSNKTASVDRRTTLVENNIQTNQGGIYVGNGPQRSIKPHRRNLYKEYGII